MAVRAYVCMCISLLRLYARVHVYISMCVTINMLYYPNRRYDRLFVNSFEKAPTSRDLSSSIVFPSSSSSPSRFPVHAKCDAYRRYFPARRVMLIEKNAKRARTHRTLLRNAINAGGGDAMPSVSLAFLPLPFPYLSFS